MTNLFSFSNTTTDYIITNPQDYLVKYCDYDFKGNTYYYSMEEALWTSFGLLTTALVVPCIRDQHVDFLPADALIQAGPGLLFEVFHKYIPLLHLASQILSAIMGIVGYYNLITHKDFLCFGLYTLCLPFAAVVSHTVNQ